MLVIVFNVDEKARPLGGEEREVHRETLHRMVEEAMRYSYLANVQISILPPGYAVQASPEKEDP